MSECIFCAIVAGDAPAQRLDEDDHTASFMDINPATEGHALVAPRRHVENLWDISEDEARHVMAAARRLAHRVREALRPDGLNLIHATGRAAFQTVFHFHMHVVPRYADDAIQMPWIPKPGDPTRIAEVAALIRRVGTR